MFKRGGIFIKNVLLLEVFIGVRWLPFWFILEVLGVKWLPFWRYWGSFWEPRGTPGGFRRPVGFGKRRPILSDVGIQREPKGIPKLSKNYKNNCKKSIQNTMRFLIDRGTIFG